MLRRRSVYHGILRDAFQRCRPMLSCNPLDLNALSMGAFRDVQGMSVKCRSICSRRPRGRRRFMSCHVMLCPVLKRFLSLILYRCVVVSRPAMFLWGISTSTIVEVSFIMSETVSAAGTNTSSTVSMKSAIKSIEKICRRPCAMREGYERCRVAYALVKDPTLPRVRWSFMSSSLLSGADSLTVAVLPPGVFFLFLLKHDSPLALRTQPLPVSAPSGCEWCCHILKSTSRSSKDGGMVNTYVLHGTFHYSPQT